MGFLNRIYRCICHYICCRPEYDEPILTMRYPELYHGEDDMESGQYNQIQSV